GRAEPAGHRPPLRPLRGTARAPLQSALARPRRLRPLRARGDAALLAEHAAGGGLRRSRGDHPGDAAGGFRPPRKRASTGRDEGLARRRSRRHADPPPRPAGGAAAGLSAVKRFADLYEGLDPTTSPLAKVEAMARYFREAPRQDAAWALWFLTGRRPKRLLGTRLLVEWTLELTGTPDWLFSESYAVVGDLAECIALLLDDGTRVEHPDDTPLSVWMETRILPLRGLSPEEQKSRVTGWWRALDRRELFLLNKLLTGELRVGVSETLVLRALSEVAGLPPPVLAQRTMGDWTPSAELLERILA